MALKKEERYKYFKSKKQMVLSLIIFGILIYLFIYLGSLDYQKDVDDNKKFVQDHKIVDTNNLYKYANHTDIYSLLTNKNDAIILFGHTRSKWIKEYSEIVNKVAKDVGIKEIYYYDFLEDREQRNGTYEAILELLDTYVTYNDLDMPDIFAPTLVIIKNKEIIYFDDQTGIRKGNTSPDIYWNDYQKGLFEQELKTVFNEYNKEV